MAQKQLTFTLPNAHARARLYRAVHLLWRLTRSQAIAADVLGVSRPTFIHACNGEPTRLTLADIKRAARHYALDVKDDFEPAEFAAVQAIVMAIDPQADVAYTSASSVDKFPQVMKQWLESNWQKPLSAAVHLFIARGFKPKYLRQVIKRLVRKEPVLGMRVVDEDDNTPYDRVNEWQRIVTDEEYLAARNPTPPKPKKVTPQDQAPEKTKAYVRRADGPMIVTEDNQVAKTGHKRVVVKGGKLLADTLKDQAPKIKKAIAKAIKDAPPMKEKMEVTLSPPGTIAETNIFDDIEKRGGPSKAVQDRVNKLLGIT
jgi:hypothetical protein